MPVDYGYIPETENEAEKDELDALLISSKTFKVGDETEAKPIALLRRDDGHSPSVFVAAAPRDDKIVAVDSDSELLEWNDVPAPIKKLILDFFGHQHRFTSIESAAAAIRYVEDCKIGN